MGDRGEKRERVSGVRNKNREIEGGAEGRRRRGRDRVRYWGGED